ncbi:hypothetical protein, partial [Bacillus thuringiensis]|uniref:hypothetical protein n=1 Tax=Bacillus thuringiensis TaxID=1428 RepID=UPI0021B40C05
GVKIRGVGGCIFIGEEWIGMEECREWEERKEEVEDIEVGVGVVERKVGKIEENMEKILSKRNWLVKRIVGGMIGGLVGFVLKGGV